MTGFVHTCYGHVRGQCGIAHRSHEAAQRCCDQDQRSCHHQGGYSDRSPAVIVDGYLERDGAPVWPPHGRSLGAVQAQCGCRMDKRVNRNIQLTEDADESATGDQE